MNDLQKVRRNPYYLKVCLEAVKIRGRMLAFIWEQNKEMCLLAVKNDPSAIRHVRQEFLKDTWNALRLRSLFDPEIKRALEEMEESM